MTNFDGADCPACKTGRLLDRIEELRFFQASDRGPVEVHVTIPLSACGHCGFQVWQEAAEAMIDDAVRAAYAKLPKR
jgi:Zn ribbon nucleic-acid-binding protein